VAVFVTVVQTRDCRTGITPRSIVRNARLSEAVVGLQAVEDKTFGMKNKKGAKGQQKVAQVKQSIEATAAKAQGYAPPLFDPIVVAVTFHPPNVPWM
jgi:hypothetical protein